MSASNEHSRDLDSEVRQFVAKRIARAMQVHQVFPQEDRVFDRALYRQLLDQACEEAVSAGVLQQEGKLQCGMSLYSDDAFYASVLMAVGEAIAPTPFPDGADH